MILLRLARKSLGNRLLTTLLTVGSIGLSVALLLGVQNVRRGMRDSFSNTISGVDLIVGAKGGTIQLLLYSVFGLGTPTANLSYESYETWASHPAVEWTIPYSLGDTHRGFRVIGTTDAFYEHYRYRRDRAVEIAEGRRPTGVFDVAIGADVARELGYQVGDPIVVSHGIGAPGLMDHDDKPFRVVGILARTSTPIDRAVWVTLEGIEAIHVDWQSGAPPMPGQEVSAEEVEAMELHPHQITSFFARLTDRRIALRVQREMNTWEGEPIMAILPGIALAEMWRTVGYVEQGLSVVTIFVVLVGLLGMLVALYTSLNARRREMAILRAVGASPRKIVGLLVLESGLLAILGSLFGVAAIYGILSLLQGPIESEFGLYLPIQPPSPLELAYLAAVVLGGFLIGLVPAWKAYRNTLQDGLSLRL